MTDSKYTHILAVVDRSGSMAPVQHDMRLGLDEFFKSQAEIEGKCLVDYVMFDNTYEKVFEDVPVADAKAQLIPRGMTALLDAIGKSVTDLGQKLAARDENDRPGLVQVIVVTDGYENSSREWSASAIKDLIAKQENDYSWDFIFLGANMDAVDVGTSFGFGSGKSITYDTANTSAMSSAVAGYTTRSRLAGAAGASANSFTDDEREAQRS